MREREWNFMSMNAPAKKASSWSHFYSKEGRRRENYPNVKSAFYTGISI